MDRTVVYFDQRGKQNTETVLRLARRRAEELGIRQVVMASTHGCTAQKAARLFAGSGIELIAVSLSAAFAEEGWTRSVSERESVGKAGVRVLTTLHGLADGAAEVSIMALEAGLTPTGTEIIGIGGTDEGCDTAIVPRPAYRPFSLPL